MVSNMDIRLTRHLVVTVLLAASAVVVAWQVLFTGPGMGDNRYTPVPVSTTGNGGPAMETQRGPVTRVVSIQQDPLQSGAPNAQ
jgi:hypothetical protein